MQLNHNWKAKKYKILFFIFFIAVSIGLQAQQHTISGTLSDIGNGENLQGAVIATKDGKSTTVTNAYGYFSLTLLPGKYVIVISYVGYAAIDTSIDLQHSDIRLEKLQLKPSASGDLKSVIIVAEKPSMRRHIQATQMGVVDLPVNLLKKVPSILGEADIIKALQLTPGVKRGGEGTVGMYVRGGGADENLILLDEATVYNAGHLLGFFSVFNTEAIKEVQLYKSNFPARYGGRLSSILDVRMKEGNMEKFQVDGSLGFISSNITLQGPLVKNKSSFIVSARRTYLDVVTANTIPYHFYDVNAKLNQVINKRNRIYLSLYKGDDVLSIAPANDNSSLDLRSGLKLGNSVLSFRWNHIFKNPRLFANTSLIYTRFRYNIEGQFDNNALLVASSIRDVGVRTDFNFKPNNNHTIQFGGQIIQHFFNPNIVNTAGLVADAIKNKPGQKIYNTELGIYGSDEFNLTPTLSMNTGLRLTGDVVPGKTYVFAEPRLAARFLIDNKNSIKMSYARMVQNMHLVASSSVALPTDLWYPVTKKIAPVTSDQVSIGYYKNIAKHGIAFSIEGYYKWMKKLIEYKEGASLILNDNYENELVVGKGKSYGIELFAAKTTGRLQGWIGYTLSYATRRFDSLNDGKQYFSKYDRRHDFSLVVAYDLSKRWSFAANLLYSTGAPFTGQVSQFIAPSPTFTNIEVLPVYTTRNALRLSGAARIDLDFSKKFSIAKKIKAEWHMGCYNFLNSVQPGRVTREYDPVTDKYVYKQKGLFGFIPSIGINFHF